MPNNNQKSNQGHPMERQFQVDDSIFQSKIGVIGNSHKHKNGNFRKSPNDNSDSFLNADGGYFLGYIQTTFLKLFKEQEMATVKLGWMLLSWVGFPVYAYAWLLSVMNGDEFKSWILTFFGVVFMIIEGLRRYEGYRSRRIDNDERIYQNNKLHKKDEDVKS